MSSSHLYVLVFSIINLLCLASVLESLSAQRFRNRDDSPIIYQRYVRKRPSPYEEDSYMEEVHEIFETRYRPPYFATFNDDEIDQFLRCDIEPHLKECDKLRKQQDITKLILPFTKPFMRTTTTTASSVKLQPIPIRPTLRPHKPTPAIDPYPPSFNEENDIPMLPAISEENVEAENTTENAISYEAENNDNNLDENYDDDVENIESNYVDEEDGDDF